MLKFEITKKKKTIYVDDIFELVTWLRKTDTQSWSDNREYMSHFAMVTKSTDNKKINYSNENEFIDSLIDIGELKPINEKKTWNFIKFKYV